jgi:aryl carrier-like protein
MAAGLERTLQKQGMGMILPAQERQLFGYLLQHAEELPGQVGVLPQRTARTAPSTWEALRFDRQVYARCSPDEQQVLLVGLLQQTLMQVGGFSTGQVSPTQDLLSVGLDSLMALEWRKAIEQLLAVRMPLSRLLEGGSLSTTALLLRELLAQQGNQVAQQLQPPGTPRIDVDALFLSGSLSDGNDPDGCGEDDDDTFAEEVV